MCGERRRRAREIFNHCRVAESPGERASRLAAGCGGDADVEAAVVELLEAHDGNGSFLEKPVDEMLADSVAGDPAVTIASPAADEVTGSRIGPYRLLRQIGEGGFGVVYMAEQDSPVRRLVALKIVKPGMDTKEVVARFETERQALAMMDHPNIARVFDAGTTGDSPDADAATTPADSDAGELARPARPSYGRPYFVMELVHGSPVTDFCDDNRLSTRHRLELFLDVCRAVQHAHQRGIIHRDLKPSNVLVGLHDDKPVPKVIDFGVSKAVGGRLTGKTLFTSYGQMIGTPLYMSPEQAVFSGFDVDTRSDVYSLGVLLYELLTGSTPFDRDTLQTVGLDELRRMIREVDPPRPSARLGTLKADALSTVSGRRQAEPRRYNQSLRGELDWIVMKALEKDRNRRYESASALAADVERYLADAPVLARPPSTGYRFRKFAARNKGLLTTSLLVVVTLLAGTGASVWQAVEANSARKLADERLEAERKARLEVVEQQRKAEENLHLAEEAVAMFVHDFAKSDHGAEGMNYSLSPTARILLRRAARFYDRLVLDSHDVRVHLNRAEAYQKLARDAQRGPLSGPPDTVESEYLREAEQACSEVLRLDPEHGARSMRARIRSRLGLFAAAVADMTVGIQKQPMNDVGWWTRALFYERHGQYDLAIADHNRAVELGADKYGVHHRRALCHLKMREYRLAIADLTKELAIREEWRRTHARGPASWDVYMLRGEARAALGEYDAAISDLTESIRINTNPHAHGARLARAHAHRDAEKWELALADYNHFVDKHPSPEIQAMALAGRGELRARRGEHDEAAADFEEALKRYKGKVGKDRPVSIKVGLPYGRFLSTTPSTKHRKPKLALHLADNAVARHPFDPEAWRFYALAKLRVGDSFTALGALDEAKARDRGREDGEALFLRAMAAWDEKHEDEARRVYDEAVAWMEANRPDDEELSRFRREAAVLLGIPADSPEIATTTATREG